MITFVANSLLTNTDHTQEGMLLLQSMMRFWLQMLQSLADGMQCMYLFSCLFSTFLLQSSIPTVPSLDEDSSMAHMPNIFTLDGIVDIYYVATVLEMADVLHPATYTAEGVPGKERLEQINGRRDARTVCQLIWLLFDYDTSQYNPKLKLKYSLEELYWQCLSYLMGAVVVGSQIADRDGIFCLSGERFGSTLMKILSVHFIPNTYQDSAFWNAWRATDIQPHTFSWKPFNDKYPKLLIKRKRMHITFI
jgi:hypothetical protein